MEAREDRFVPLNEDEARRKAQGRPFAARDGGGYVAPVPPSPPAQYIRLTEADGDPIGRRVIHQTPDGHLHGFYVWDSPVLNDGRVYYPIVTEHVWWQSQTVKGYTPAADQIVQVAGWWLWLDESDGEYRKAWLAAG